MILAQSLTKKYGQRTAISDVSFSVEKGEIVGFLGPNGAGKTTTMKILTGCMAPNKGSAFLNKIDVLKEPFKAKKKLGYLPEQAPLYFDMRVESYLKYVAQLKLCAKNKIPGLVSQAIQKTGLKQVKNRLIQNLSKGFKQRVGLAQALVSDPEILILDEPTVGLDPKQMIEIRNTLNLLKNQHTIVLSSHILSEISAICDRVIIINEGKIVSQDSLKNLKTKSSRRFVLRVKKSSPQLESQLKSLKGLVSLKKTDKGFFLNLEPDDNLNEKVAQIAIKNSAGFLELKEEGFSLEDEFIRLTENSKEVIK